MDATGAEPRYRPFSNGTEYYGWQEVNCDRCARSADTIRPAGDATLEDVICDIQYAIWHATMDDGSVSGRIAVRMGLMTDDGQERLHCGRCPEFVPLGRIPRTPKPPPATPTPGLFDTMEDTK